MTKQSVVTAEDLFQLLQKLSPEERKQQQLFAQVPPAEYDSYYINVLRIKVDKIDRFQLSSIGVPALCFITDDNP